MGEGGGGLSFREQESAEDLGPLNIHRVMGTAGECG